MPDQWGSSRQSEIEATKKYQKDHVRQISLKLNTKTDADIIEYLDSIKYDRYRGGRGEKGEGGAQGAIKKAIRWMIQSQRIANGEQVEGCTVQPICDSIACDECCTEEKGGQA